MSAGSIRWLEAKAFAKFRHPVRLHGIAGAGPLFAESPAKEVEWEATTQAGISAVTYATRGSRYIWDNLNSQQNRESGASWPQGQPLSGGTPAQTVASSWADFPLAETPSFVNRRSDEETVSGLLGLLVPCLLCTPHGPLPAVPPLAVVPRSLEVSSGVHTNRFLGQHIAASSP